MSMSITNTIKGVFMSEPQTIMINDVKYVRLDSVHQSNNSGPKDIRIIILPRGWNLVGEYSCVSGVCTIKNASVIRRWGTSNGLGELAKNGPLPNTILDECNGDVEILQTNIIATINCEYTKW